MNFLKLNNFLILNGERKELKRMRKLLNVMLVLFVGIFMFSVSAHALPELNICNMHNFEFTNYEQLLDGTTGLQKSAGQEAVGDIYKGIFHSEGIRALVGTVWETKWLPNDATYENAELTGVYDNLVISSVVGYTDGSGHLHNTISFNVDNAYVQTYYDLNPDYDPSAIALGYSTAGGTAAEKYIKFKFDYFSVDYDFHFDKAEGTGFLSVVDGENFSGYEWDPMAWEFPTGTYHEFYLTNEIWDTGKYGGAPWTYRTDDDFEGHPIPEPCTMLLLGSGLIGMAGFARKKFRK